MCSGAVEKRLKKNLEKNLAVFPHHLPYQGYHRGLFISIKPKKYDFAFKALPHVNPTLVEILLNMTWKLRSAPVRCKSSPSCIKPENGAAVEK